MRKIFWAIAVVELVLSMSLASVFSADGDMKDVAVAVSILPQKYFVERIAGKSVSVTVMVPPGANPATYEPKPTQMKALSKASLYFSIGVPFERIWLERFVQNNPSLEVIDTQEGIRLYPMKGHTGHGHRLRGTRIEFLDPHTWLAPHLVAIQARNIFRALVRRFPEKRESMQKNYRKFLLDIEELDEELMNRLLFASKAQSRRTFMVFHPSWGYFARAYGLKQLAIEEEGKEPKAGSLISLAKMAREMNIGVILVQPQFSSRAARSIADSLGIELVEADPLAYDWPANLRKVAVMLAERLQ